MNTKGISETGRKFLGSVLEPFFNMGFNLAILHSSGKIDRFIYTFIILLKRRAYTSALSFRNFAETFTGIKAKQNLFTNIFK